MQLTSCELEVRARTVLSNSGLGNLGYLGLGVQVFHNSFSHVVGFVQYTATPKHLTLEL